LQGEGYSFTDSGTPALVQVTFDGEDAEIVETASDALLRVRVPQATLNPNVSGAIDPAVSRATYPAVDIVITNLDTFGVPVPGETVTAPSAYTYEQPLLARPEEDPPSMQVLRALLRLLKRGIVSDVAKTTHTDYGIAGSTFTKLSEHPSVGVSIQVLKDAEYCHYDNESFLLQSGGSYLRFDMQTTVMYVATLTLDAQHEREALSMIDAFVDLQNRTPWLRVDRDPRWAEAGAPNMYPLEITQMPNSIGGTNRSNISAYQAQLRIRGVPLVVSDHANFVHARNTVEFADGAFSAGTPAIRFTLS
jgi:hypothetical protein